MSALSAKLRDAVDRDGNHIITWWCPGCDCAHDVRVDGQHAWRWDGDTVAPTFTPSVLSRTAATVCHCYVRAGMIEFLGDSTHALAGQTVALPGWPFGGDGDNA